MEPFYAQHDLLQTVRKEFNQGMSSLKRKTKKKLTMVSIFYQGKYRTTFVYADYINGKAIVSDSVVNHLAIGIPRGNTFSIG